MADSGFDTLNSFKTQDLVIEPVSPKKNQMPISGGSFSVSDPVLQEETDAKDTINYDLASQMVDETPDWNDLALEYVQKMIPVRENAEYEAGLIAEKLGLGKRVTFDEAYNSITEQLGDIPRTSSLDKTLNFLVDSLNARTPYKGAAGIFDVIAQASGKYLQTETAEKAATINHQLKMKEMAIQYMQDANSAMLEKEGEFYMKKMGIDNDFMQKYMSFTGDLALKQAQFDMDTIKNKQEAALDLFKNPNRLFQNMTIINDDGTTQIVMTKKVWNPKTGEYEFMMPRKDGAGGTVFDIEVPPNSYLSPLDGPQTDAALAIKAPNFGQASELIGDFNTLGRAGDIVTNMLKIDEEAIATGKPSRFGIEGGIDYVLQEGRYTLASLFDAFAPGSGKLFVDEGRTLYEKDKARYQLQPGDEEVFRTIDFQLPNAEGFVDKTKQMFGGNTEPRTVSIDDFFRTSTYVGLGYDESYAQLKVQENLIIYALARALKPTGRLNVDDIQRASQLVNLQGLKSPQYVRAQLKEILRFIRTAQVDIYDSGQYGDKNIFDDPKYSTQVDTFRQFIGVDPKTVTETPAQNSEGTTSTSATDENLDTIDMSNEQLFTGTGGPI